MMMIMNTNHRIVMQEIHSIHLFVFKSFLTHVTHLLHICVALKTKGTCVLAMQQSNGEDIWRISDLIDNKKHNAYNIPKNSQKTIKLLRSSQSKDIRLLSFYFFTYTKNDLLKIWSITLDGNFQNMGTLNPKQSWRIR
jgi:hypothetical protein